MLALDRDALLCDLAETYGVFSLGSLPPKTTATLALGLRENARIRLKLAGMRFNMQSLLLAGIYDRLGTLVWFQSKDGQKNRNRPAGVLPALLNDAGDDQKIVAFATPADFKAARAAILRS